MAAVVALQQIHLPPPAVAIDIQPNPQDQRVVEASKGIFETVKATSVRVWEATVIGISAAGDKISFVFFRVLEWIHPSLGPKIEVVFLRITNIWQAIKDAWKAEETRKQIEDLSVDNLELRQRTRDYDQILLERNQFQQSNHALLAAKNFAEEALRLAQQQEQNIVGREQAVIEYRDIVVLKNQRLEQENLELTRQRDEARQALTPFLEGNQQLRDELAAVQQQVLDLQQQIPAHQEMQQQFAIVAQAIGKVQRIGRTEIDDGLDALLPLLSAQILQAKDKLNQVRATVVPYSPTAIALQSFERIMGTVETYLGQVTAAMQLHGNYHQPVNRLIFNLNQRVAV